MNSLQLTNQLKFFIKYAIRFTHESQAAAILLLLEGTADWKRLKNLFETANRLYGEEVAKLQETEAAGSLTEQHILAARPKTICFSSVTRRIP